MRLQLTQCVDTRVVVLQKPLLYLASGRPLAIGFYFDWRCRTDPQTGEFHSVCRRADLQLNPLRASVRAELRPYSSEEG
jgi:hypothetical protein